MTDITAPVYGDLADPTWAASITSAVNALNAYQSSLTSLTGAWTDWTPTLTNMAKGSGGVVEARYRTVGKTGDLEFKFTLGTGSTVGTAPNFTLPFTLRSTYVSCIIANGYLLQTGTTSRLGGLYVNSTTVCQITYLNATPIPDTQVTATAPFTWASGHIMFFRAVGLELA